MAKLFFALAAVMAAACAQRAPGTILDIAESLPQFSTLVAVAAKTGLAPLLSAPGVKTVFAPTNDAFGALGNNTLAWITNDRNQQELLNVLYYHFTAGAVTSDVLSKVSTLPTFDQGPSGAEVVTVTSSGDIRINNARVGPADVAASNGVIQVIDHVLIPSNIALPSKDIVQTAQATPPLSTLVKAVVAASLAAALSQPNGPFTVFAPLDSAFAAVPSEVLSCLLSKPDALRVLLLSHVVPGLVYSSDIPPTVTVSTLSGKQLTLNVRGTSVSIVYSTLLFPSNVVMPNVDTSNGVVHVIDRVLFDNSGPCGR